MSIGGLNKIGDWLRANQADIAIVVGFILVALIAFGAGRLTAPEIVRNPVVIEEPNASSSVNLYGGVSQTLSGAGESIAPKSQKGIFVASRNSKKYHWPWCSWAQKIKTENQIRFNSETEAQQAGYSPCTCIASKAPAGYNSE